MMPIGIAVRYLKKGEWEKAHASVQEDESALACWAHGIEHMQEGDLANARSWYRRAPRAFPRTVDIPAELAALAVAVKEAAQ